MTAPEHQPRFYYCFNPEDNGGESFSVMTFIHRNGTDEPFTTQELTLNSYCNQSTFHINSYLTPEKLRDCANKLEVFLNASNIATTTLMTNLEEHPITPSPELRCQWQSESPFKVISVEREDYMIDRASQWAADQELEACCKWLDAASLHLDGGYLRADRRPKPSLKEQAITKLKDIRGSEYPCNLHEDSDWDIILHALEALPND